MPTHLAVDEPRLDVFEFIVIGAPLSQNQAYRRRKGWGMFKTNAAECWQLGVGLRAKTARPKNWSLDGQMGVGLTFHFDSRRPDLDGPLKLALDAMEDVVYHNDRQITDILLRKRLDRANPRTEISVWHVPSP